MMLQPELQHELIVFGTPAEEAGGGKVKMIEKGVFDETDICMMSHPTPYEIPIPNWLAISELRIVFNGKEAFIKYFITFYFCRTLVICSC